MLSKLIVNSYSIIIEIALWLLLLVALIGGWSAGGFLGGLGALLVTFALSALFVGAVLVLDDIRKHVKEIAAKN